MLWKYYKNIVNVTLFFFFNSSSDFDNNNFFFLPFSAMTLPQFRSIFFSPPIFGNAIATITKNKNSPYLGDTMATIIFLFFFFFFFPHIFGNGIVEIGENFFHLFWQSHCHNSIIIIFFLINDRYTQFLQQILSGRLLLLD